MKHQFKPFDRVLVRDDNTQPWKCGMFSHYTKDETFKYECVGNLYAQCIPYNEQTAHLVNTNKPYKDEQLEKKIHVWTTGTFNEWMNEDEFKNFINIAVLHNKDITDFHVMYMQ